MVRVRVEMEVLNMNIFQARVDTWNEKPCKILTYITCFLKVFSITGFIARLHSVRAKMVRVRVKINSFFTRTHIIFARTE